MLPLPSYRFIVAGLAATGAVLVALSWWMHHGPPAEEPAPASHTMHAARHESSAVARAFLPQGAAGEPLPAPKGGNLYATPGAWRDQDGHPFSFADLRGRPAVFAFIYTSCEHVCPLLVESLQAALETLPPELREAVRPLLLSFDPARDGPAAMREFAEKMALADGRWSIVSAAEADVRRVAEMVGFRYAPRGDHFEHNLVVAVAGADGEIRGIFGKEANRSDLLGRALAGALEP